MLKALQILKFFRSITDVKLISKHVQSGLFCHLSFFKT